MPELEPLPWSLKPKRPGLRTVLAAGAGALLASFYIGTGDITVGTSMGARFGFSMWWTYPLLGAAGLALADMTVRYYLRFGRTPMAIFKELHPLLAFYMFLTVTVTGILGAYSQWNSCAVVVSGFFPDLPLEAGGALSALAGGLLLVQGGYRRLEVLFGIALILLILLFAGSALAAGAPWGEALAGLIPSVPDEGRSEWRSLLEANAGSMINAWLILVYPYTLREKGRLPDDLRGRVDLLQRSRWDFGSGMAAAALVALPIMAASAAVARPFGILPRNAADFAAILEPMAGRFAAAFFLGGLFVAAWTSGVGWAMTSAYALLDLAGLPVSMRSRPFRLLIALLLVPSVLILFLRVNPFEGILLFTYLLAAVTPLIALALLYRLSRRDMGYFRWSTANARGISTILLDLFGAATSLWIGWGMLRHLAGGGGK